MKRPEVVVLELRSHTPLATPHERRGHPCSLPSLLKCYFPACFKLQSPTCPALSGLFLILLYCTFHLLIGYVTYSFSPLFRSAGIFICLFSPVPPVPRTHLVHSRRSVSVE